MHHKIVRRISRPDSQPVKLLGQLRVATVHGAQGRRRGCRRLYVEEIREETPVKVEAL
jgi:hypothetical protein